MPVGTPGEGSYIVHTFMAEVGDVTSQTCETEIASSSDFRGQGGNFTSATYNRLPISGKYYSSTKVSNISYVEEGDY